MGLKKIVKKGFSLGFQPKRWLGLEQVKSNGKICINLINELVIQKKSAAQSDADANTAAPPLSAQELKSRQSLGLRLFYGYLIASIGLVGYAVYLAWVRHLYLSAAMSVVVAFLVLNFSLRELLVYIKILTGRDRVVLRDAFHFIFR